MIIIIIVQHQMTVTNQFEYKILVKLYILWSSLSKQTLKNSKSN